MTIASIFEVVKFAIFSRIYTSEPLPESVLFNVEFRFTFSVRGTSRRGSEVQCAISDGPWVRGVRPDVQRRFLAPWYDHARAVPRAD